MGACRRLRPVAVVLGTVFLAVGTTTCASEPTTTPTALPDLVNDELSGDGNGLAVTCDAEYDEHFEGYHVDRDTTLDCEVHGLEGEDANWSVRFYDADTHLEQIAGSITAGATNFSIPIPDADVWFDGHVAMRRGTTPPSETPPSFTGTTWWVTQYEAQCSPDPVKPGDTVECEAASMEPGSFEYSVVFFDEAFDEEIGEPVEGTGTADATGRAAVAFDFPADGTIVAYWITILQDHYEAVAGGGTE
jgi:hypothetical protein